MNNEKDEEMTTITVSLPVNLVERIKSASKYLDVNKDVVIKYGVRNYLNSYEEEWSERYKGMEDVRKGNVYTQEESDEYFDGILENLRLRKQQKQLLRVGS